MDKPKRKSWVCLPAVTVADLRPNQRPAFFIWCEGMDAFFDGLGRDACPYSGLGCGKQKTVWKQGWDCGANVSELRKSYNGEFRRLYDYFGEQECI